MSMRADPEWEEPSEPEISIGALTAGHSNELKANIIGERFGNYLLVGEIAVGGMAEIFLAVHKGVEGFVKVVVIKRVLPHLSNNPDFVRMFIDEARLEARLEHPNIVRAYEFGEVDGQYFSAMEYLPGEDLCKALHRLSISKQVMPIHVATGIASQLCAGLHFAHQFTDTDGHPLGLVHRDINPANVMITYGGEVKIIDFGVAKSNSNAQTLTGTIKGKVAYMPPEQVLGREVDHRADIFSAGVVLWEMLTGRPLFGRDNDAATLYAIMNAPIVAPSRIRPEVPTQLDKIAGRALARRPADRFETAEEMAAALDEFMAEAPRYDRRVLATQIEELFGSTRAEAKRQIAQTRALARNISTVMKLRSEVRADLAERLDLVVTPLPRSSRDFPRRPAGAAAGSGGATEVDAASTHPGESRAAVTAVPHSRSQRALMIALAAVMVAGIAGGLTYTTRRSSESSIAKPSPGVILLDSTPPGAAVFVAGEPTGLKTPAALSGITSKQLSVRLELAGHAPVTRAIDVLAGATVSAQIALAPLGGRLILSDLPAGASIFIDDSEFLAGDVIAVSAGRHAVRVEASGRTVVQQWIDTTAGDQGLRLVSGKLVRN
jgi:serine/threonine protein kinase